MQQKKNNSSHYWHILQSFINFFYHCTLLSAVLGWHTMVTSAHTEPYMAPWHYYYYYDWYEYLHWWYGQTVEKRSTCHAMSCHAFMDSSCHANAARCIHVFDQFFPFTFVNQINSWTFISCISIAWISYVENSFIFIYWFDDICFSISLRPIQIHFKHPSVHLFELQQYKCHHFH